MSYVLKRTDQDEGFVAKKGYKTSYTNDLRFVRFFDTREEAERNRCKGNEIILNTNEI